MSSRIASGKVVAGGVLAAVVLAAFDFATSNFLLADEWQVVAQRHSIDPDLMGGTGALATMLVVDLVLGLLLVLVYAAIRPRFGPGPVTGAIASFFVFVPSAGLLATFAGWLLPWDLYIRQSIVVLVAMLGAGFAGAWVYAEEEE
jgi:hypothetical protein